MMTEQTFQKQTVIEQDAPFPTPEIPTTTSDIIIPGYDAYDPYESLRTGDAYGLIQREIMEFAAFQQAAIDAAMNQGDMQRLNAALRLEKSVKASIRFQIEQGHLQPDILNHDDIVTFETNEYFHRSLETYKQHGPDAIAFPLYEAYVGEFVPTPGVNIDTKPVVLPTHITEVATDELSDVDQETAGSFETIIMNTFKKLGAKTMDILGVTTFHSGKIDLPQTKILPVTKASTEIVQ